MTYTYIDHNHPVISNNKIPTENWARNNLTNLRDFLVLTGLAPGWNFSMTPGGGTDYTQPSTVMYSKGVEGIKVDFSWNANGYPNKGYIYYSNDNRVTWTPLTDTAGKYVVTYAYDANENCTGETWGVT